MDPPIATQTAQRASFKWKTAIALLLLVVAILMNWNWVWGILFIAWALNDLVLGVTYFVEEIARKKNPILFWTIVILWLALGLYSLADGWLFSSESWN